MRQASTINIYFKTKTRIITCIDIRNTIGGSKIFKNQNKNYNPMVNLPNVTLETTLCYFTHLPFISVVTNPTIIRLIASYPLHSAGVLL